MTASFDKCFFFTSFIHQTILYSMIKKLFKRNSLNQTSNRTSFNEEKQRILNLILGIVITFGFVTISLTVIEYNKFVNSTLGLLYFSLYFIFIIIFILRNRISQTFTTVVLMMVSYLFGCQIMYNEGFFGGTLMIFVTIIALSTLLLGSRFGFFTLGLCVLANGIGAYLFSSQLLVVSEGIKESNTHILSWTVMVLIFIFMAILLILAIGQIQAKLHESLAYRREQSETLNKANSELTEIKKNLEQKVNERTQELELKNIELTKGNKELLEMNKQLEKFNDLFVGREFRIKELKNTIAKLQKQING